MSGNAANDGSHRAKPAWNLNGDATAPAVAAAVPRPQHGFRAGTVHVPRWLTSRMASSNSLDEKLIAGLDLSSLQIAYSAGAPLPNQVRTEFGRMFGCRCWTASHEPQKRVSVTPAPPSLGEKPQRCGIDAVITVTMSHRSGYQDSGPDASMPPARGRPGSRVTAVRRNHENTTSSRAAAVKGPHPLSRDQRKPRGSALQRH